jgi:chemotaxis protein MotA
VDNAGPARIVDKSTIVGLILAFVLIAGAMALGGSLFIYIDVPSLFIVLGGTFSAALMSQGLGNIVSGLMAAKNAFFDRPNDPVAMVDKFVELSRAARARGLLALENESVPTDFMKKGLRLVCDGMSPEELRATLDTERYALERRHKGAQQVFRFMAGTAPAMGMVGTLIGLVAMLKKLDDPSSIGPAMAVALLTTLYGSLIAFVVMTPIGDKLAGRTKDETVNMLLIVEGCACIARGDNPLMIREKLNAFLAPKKREAQASPEK